MNISDWVPLGVKSCVALSVLAIGLQSRVEDAMSLFRRPAVLVRSLLSMSIVMPLFATLLVLLLDLQPVVKVVLVSLSVSPVPPILPRKAAHAGGSASYAVGLLVAAAVLSLLLIPLAVDVLESVFEVPLHAPVSKLAGIVLATVVAPFAMGVLIRHSSAAFAGRVAQPVSIVSMTLLLLVAIPVLLVEGRTMLQLAGDGTVAAMAAFVGAGLLVGHFAAGPSGDERVVLALSTSMRHPGVALAVGMANFADVKPLVAAVFLYLLVASVVTLPYTAWSRRRLVPVRSAV